MNYIQFALTMLLILFVFILITKIIMSIATFIGNRIGFFNIFISLYRKIKNK
jgi:hypothetical protein